MGIRVMAKLSDRRNDLGGTKPDRSTAGRTLDDVDLGIVEAGAGGMRSWTDAERRLVFASGRARDRKRRTRAILWATAIGAVGAIVAATGVATFQWQSSERAARDANRRRVVAEAQ